MKDKGACSVEEGWYALRAAGRELQNEIPVQVGKYDTNRITEAGESGNTKTDGTKTTCLFCYGRKSRRGKEREDGKVFEL